MKIIKLTSSNIKRIRAVELQLDDKKNLVLITGKNGQGKTSILDSIWYALGGKKAVHDKPIRDGEESGEIEIDVEGYIVKRTFTDKGSYLQITNKDGSKYSNPQEFLDYITGNLSFDPLEFSRMDEKKQITELTRIVGLDLTPLDGEKKSLTEERLLIGRDMKTIGKIAPETVESMKSIDQTPIDTAGLQEKYRLAIEKKNYKDNLEQRGRDMENDIKSLEEDLVKINNQLALLKAGLSTNQEELKNIVLDDPNKIQEEITLAAKATERQSEAKRIISDDLKYQEKDAEYKNLTEKIRLIDEEKAQKLSSIKMPIDGLSWDEDKVLYNGIPFSQSSAAEQLRVSMAIAMASNPKLKVILIRDGSLLDADNLKVIEEMARDNDFQVWVEIVDDTGKLGIYIEDGEIKTIN